MNRRNFLNLSAVTALCILLPTKSNASFLESIKYKVYDFIKKYRKYDITFAKIYPKPIWEKSYFSWIVLATTIVIAGAVSYFTAGAGAPEAAAGVSTVASWIGGGGAGSYMAGLSTVGSVVGGNVMVGAAILNGISLGTIGWGAGKTTLALASKIAVITDCSLNGFVIIKSSSQKDAIYIFDIKLPKGIGDEKIQMLVNNIYEIYDKQQDLLEKKHFEEANLLNETINKFYLLGNKLLKKELIKNSPDIYNLIVLGIIAYKTGNLELYQEALNTILVYKEKIRKRSFLDYLLGIYYLSIPNNKENVNKAFNYFQQSYYEENYVIEPILVIIDILAQNYYKNKILITSWVKNAVENYDEDKYEGKNLFNLYYKAAAVSFLNNDWTMAITYYKKAYDKLGIIGKLIWTTKPIKKQIKLYIAICYKNLQKYQKAKEYFSEALALCENNKEKQEIQRIYNES